MDVYDNGDRYGYGIDIRSDGSYLLYRRFYRTRAEEQPSIREKEVGQGELTGKEFGSLRSQVDSLDLASIPRRLPDVDPRKVEIRGPAESVVLKMKTASSGELIEIRADMGADRKHYPPAFLRLHRDLKQLIRERLNKEDG